MSFRTEGTDLIFEGWEDGTAESPFTGNLLVRQVNITDSPKEVFVNYDLQANFTAGDAVSVTINTGTDVVTYTPALNALTGTYNTIQTGTPFYFTAAGTPSGITLITTYYAIFQGLTLTSGVPTAGTFKVATTLANALAGTADVDFTTTGTTVVVHPIAPDFCNFSGGISAQVSPYPTTYTTSTGTAYQYISDANYNAASSSQYVSNGKLWYNIGVDSNRAEWSFLHPSTQLLVASIDTATDIITLGTGGDLQTNTAVRFAASGTMPAPLAANTTYYVLRQSSTTIKLSATLGGSAINLTTTGTGTQYILFNDCYGIASNWGYVFVFRNYQIDLMKISDGTWILNWQNGSPLTPSQSHRAITSQNNIVYFANGNQIGSITQTPGSTFDPTSSATYVFLTAALGNLPSAENVISMSELGANLLIGGVFGMVYVWDQINQLGTSSVSIRVPDQRISELVTVNTTTYIFAGTRGRIYQTNGSSAILFKKLPDNTSGVIQPMFFWKCATGYRNELLFNAEVQDNSGTSQSAQSSEAGLWAIDLGTNVYSQNTANALRLINTFSYGVSSSMTYAVAAFILPLAVPGGGLSYVTGWTVTASNVVYSGFDGFIALNYGTLGGTPDGGATGASPNYRSAGGAQVVGDLVRVGATFTKKTFSQVEFTLSQPLAAGEGIRIEARPYIGQSGTEFVFVGQTVATTSGFNTWTNVNPNPLGGALAITNGTPQSTSGPCISDVYPANFQGYVWLQIRATLYSVGFTSSPSYVRLRDIRVR